MKPETEELFVRLLTAMKTEKFSRDDVLFMYKFFSEAKEAAEKLLRRIDT